MTSAISLRQQLLRWLLILLLPLLLAGVIGAYAAAAHIADLAYDRSLFRAALAQPAQHFGSVNAGQAEIENGQVVIFILQHVLCLLAVAGTVHGITGLCERTDEAVRQRGIVFDNQDAHERSA